MTTIELRPVRVQRRYGTQKRWNWTAYAENGLAIGRSEQPHVNKWYARRKALRQFPGAKVEEA